jgi:hypothetical protein
MKPSQNTKKLSLNKATIKNLSVRSEIVAGVGQPQPTAPSYVACPSVAGACNKI